MDRRAALENLKWRLSRNAEEHSFKFESRRLRVTFSEELRDEPVYRLFCWIEGDIVALAWIEKVEDALPFGFDDWLDDVV